MASAGKPKSPVVWRRMRRTADAYYIFVMLWLDQSIHQFCNKMDPWVKPDDDSKG